MFVDMVSYIVKDGWTNFQSYSLREYARFNRANSRGPNLLESAVTYITRRLRCLTWFSSKLGIFDLLYNSLTHILHVFAKVHNERPKILHAQSSKLACEDCTLIMCHAFAIAPSSKQQKQSAKNRLVGLTGKQNLTNNRVCSSQTRLVVHATQRIKVNKYKPTK